MDEVHYLADRFRGAVWEEVILQLPEHVALVGLSATVSNAEEFGDWLVTVRGDTSVVVDEHRPVPLWQHMMVATGCSTCSRCDAGTPSGGAAGRPRAGARHPRAGPPVRHRRVGPGPARPRRGTPPAGRVPAAVADHRAGPAGPRRAAPGDHLRVQPRRLRRRRRAVRPGRAAADHDEEARRDPPGRRAPHRRPAAGRPGRAGLLGVAGRRWSGGSPRTTPGCCRRSRRPSRSCSSAAWCRRCSPPRRSRWASTCRPAPSCWSGWSSSTARRTPTLTPGEYTQLTGRAGRRGIDVEGHAVVVWQPGRGPAAGRRAGLDPHLPAAQLLPARLQHGRQPRRPPRRAAARELLEQSFGQFQADRSVVGLARRIERNAETLAGYAGSMRCHLGDFAEYAALRRRLGEREKALRRQGMAQRRDAPTTRCARCVPATSSRCRAGGGPGWPSCSTPGWTTATTRARWCSPRTAGPGGSRRPTSPRR